MNPPRLPAASDTPVHYRGTARCTDDNIGLMVKLVYNSLNRMPDLELAPLDLTAMQWRPIAMVARGPADTPAQMQRLHGVATGPLTPPPAPPPDPRPQHPP